MRGHGFQFDMKEGRFSLEEDGMPRGNNCTEVVFIGLLKYTLSGGGWLVVVPLERTGTDLG